MTAPSAARPLRVGIVAGEPSGDALGAAVLQALRARQPALHIDGVGGPRLQAAGCQSLFPMERLAVMGLTEVLRDLPGLLRLRARLVAHWRANPPDVFLGVDAPDFNLGLEARLRAGGIPTAHLVSPSVWAWRQWRLKRIAASVDCMLTLFPFEAAFYQDHAVPVRWVGHPLADELPLQPEPLRARAQLGINESTPLVAVLPGSRLSEVRRLSEPMVAACRQLAAARPALRFVAPLATAATQTLFQQVLAKQAPELPLTVLQGDSLTAMAAADVVLLASGTATLEAMLLQRPMVVAYRVSPVTAWLLRRLLQVPWVALPNLLAQTPLVPEVLQAQVSGQRLAREVTHWLDLDPHERARWQQHCARLHTDLRRDAAARSAQALLDLVHGTRGQ